MERFLQGMDEKTLEINERDRNLLDALRYFVGNIAERQVKNKRLSQGFVSALTGLVFTLLKDRLPKELLAFMRHANRKTIKDDDLLLFCRKTSLRDILSKHSKSVEGRNEKTKKPVPEPDNSDIDYDYS